MGRGKLSVVVVYQVWSFVSGAMSGQITGDPTQKENSNMSNATDPKKEEIQKAPMADGDSGYVKWGEMSSGKKDFSEGAKEYLERVKFEEGKIKKLRLVSKPYKFWRHYDPIMAISPGFAQDPCWQAGHRARERYAILVIDREDGILKILEGGPKIFSAFKGYFELSEGKLDPAGKMAPDWAVKVTVPPRMKDGRMVKDKRNTTYEVQTIPGTDGHELSPKEIAYVREKLVKLEEVFKPLSADIISEMFEDAKKMQPGDPIPGTGDWWKNRRAKKDEGNTGGNSGAYVAPQQESPLAPIVEDADIAAGAGFDSLFPGEDGDGPQF
jgi:hypothetical protein